MEDVTVLLQRLTDGDKRAADELLPIVYDELRRRAAAYMSRERANHTLQATGLVHEAYIKLVGANEIKYQSRAHFFNAAAEAMRRLLVDHSRATKATKRGGDKARIALEDVNLAVHDTTSIHYEALDVALNELKSQDERRYQVVMLRYFAGLDEKAIAEALELSVKTVQRDWKTSKIFLLERLQRQ